MHPEEFLKKALKNKNFELKCPFCKEKFAGPDKNSEYKKHVKLVGIFPRKLRWKSHEYLF